MDDVTFREATLADAPLIQPLVHHAYRGDRAKVGWTHEADLLDAQRIDEDQLRASIADPAHAILLAEQGGALIGCVQVSDKGEGLAYRLIDQAERFARDRYGADRMEMTVIVQRAELIEWYERRGYRLTGERRPFPYSDARFGAPRRGDLEFVVMERSLA
jgi:ribosomal protein S18 acetylase RimI-like enzyme